MSDKLLKKAINKHKAGQYRDAQTLYKKILKSHPQHVDANYMLGTLFAEQGDTNNALKYMRIAEELAPGSQYIKNNTGNVYRISGDYDAAARKYNEALAIQPDMIEALNNLAIVYRRLNQTQQAITLYKNAISLSPNFIEANYNLGKAYWDESQYDDAKACFQRVLEIDPDHAMANHEMGNYYMKSGDKENAIACFKKYLSLAPEDHCGARLKLSYLDAGEMPARQPEQLVIETYEKKARTWDNDVERADIAFLGPKHIQQAVNQQLAEQSELTILDIGCGTGLCGPFLKPVATTLHGVDLSDHMLNIARKKGLYDDLVCDDLAHFIKTCNNQYDLIVASGVLIFFGDLSDLMLGVAGQLKSNGWFIFTLYKSNEADIEIRDNMHFAHSEEYIRKTVEQSGLKLVGVEQVIHEYEHDQPQPGYLVILKNVT